MIDEFFLKVEFCPALPLPLAPLLPSSPGPIFKALEASRIPSFPEISDSVSFLHLKFFPLVLALRRDSFFVLSIRDRVSLSQSFSPAYQLLALFFGVHYIRRLTFSPPFLSMCVSRDNLLDSSGLTLLPSADFWAAAESPAPPRED